MTQDTLRRAGKAPARLSLAGAKGGLNSYENRLLLVLCLGGGVAAIDAQALFYLAPFVANDLHLNNAAIGVLSSAVLVTWSIAGYAIGALSDRTGRRKPYLILTFALFAACSFLSGLATNLVTLFLARLSVGVAEGPVIPLSQTVMAANSSPHRRGFNMGVVQNFGAQLFGSFAGPILVVALATSINWRAAFFVVGIPGLLVAAAIALVVREPPAARIRPAAGAGWRDLGDLVREKNVRLCALIACAQIGWYFLMLAFLPLYCIRVAHFTPRAMSFVMAAIGAAGAVSAVVVPALSDHFGRKPILVAFSALGVVAPLAALTLRDPMAMSLLIFVGGMACGVFPLFIGAVPQESVRPELSAQATAFVMGCGQFGGGVFGPVIIGVAADSFGLQAPLIAAAALALIGAFICLHLRETAPGLAVERG